VLYYGCVHDLIHVLALSAANSRTVHPHSINSTCRCAQKWNQVVILILDNISELSAYWLGCRLNQSCISGRDKRFTFCPHVQIISRVYPAFSPVCSGGSVYVISPIPSLWRLSSSINQPQKWLSCILILGFHCALLQSITFISWLNALDCTKLRS